MSGAPTYTVQVIDHIRHVAPPADKENLFRGPCLSLLSVLASSYSKDSACSLMVPDLY